VSLAARPSPVLVRGRCIGSGHPAFIIAEGACNHLCDMALAREMVERAADAGADAIKFQTYKAESLARKEAQTYWKGTSVSQVEYYKRLDRFGSEQYSELFALAASRGIVGFSTPFDVENAQMLNDLGMPLFKIASCDLPDHRLLRAVAGFGKPTILSTGASTVEEIDAAVRVFLGTGNDQLMLMACMLSYPTDDGEANLLRIRALQARYPALSVGLSDHTQPDPHMVLPAAAIAIGASMIEKHYTLDRTMTGSGHFFAVDPGSLAMMVQNIRLVESALGDGSLGVSRVEEAARHSARRSIVANQPIAKGQVITSAMLAMKRPADGLPGSAMDQLIGRRAMVDIAADQPLSFDMLDA